MDSRMKISHLTILLILLLSTFVSALELDGKTVILLVSEHRSGDPRMEIVREELLKKRTDLGYSTEEMPIVFMGFKDSDTERKYFDRLGFQEFDSPVLCVVEWGNPARFGPKRVIDYAIARSATPQHVGFIVDNFLELRDKPPGWTPPPPTIPEGATGALEIDTVRFEASGRPLHLTNVGVRLRNTSAVATGEIAVRFFVRLPEEAGWRLIGEKTIGRLASGYVASRDIVGDTREFGLEDENGSSIRCFYRIEVETGGQTIYQEGEFVPNETPVGMTGNHE